MFQACMLTFYPEFEEAAADNEVVFLLDLSNSMRGAAIVDARRLLSLFLRHLPDTCRFNVVGFGSSCRQLFVTSQAKDEPSMQAAEQFLQTCHANMGNTVLNR